MSFVHWHLKGKVVRIGYAFHICTKPHSHLLLSINVVCCNYCRLHPNSVKRERQRMGNIKPFAEKDLRHHDRVQWCNKWSLFSSKSKWTNMKISNQFPGNPPYTMSCNICTSFHIYLEDIWSMPMEWEYIMCGMPLDG